MMPSDDGGVKQNTTVWMERLFATCTVVFLLAPSDQCISMHLASAAASRRKEKRFYFNARETHYNRFGPHIWFNPQMSGCKRY